MVFGKPLSKLSYGCLSLEKLVNRKHFPANENTFLSKKNLAWFSGKYFPFILGRKHFPEVVKIFFEISHYLLIMSNLVLKLLIAIYFVWFFFQFHPLKFDFYINFGLYFYDCYLLFSYHFFNWNFLSIKFGPHSFDCYLFYLK
jgi:hypothetical protein